MSNKRLLSLLGEIDEVYIEEAAPIDKPARRVNYKIIKWCALAAVLVITVGLGSIWRIMNSEKKMDSVGNMDADITLEAENAVGGTVCNVTLEVTAVNEAGFEAVIMNSTNEIHIAGESLVVEFDENTVIADDGGNSEGPNGVSSRIKVGDIVEVKYNKYISDGSVIFALEIDVK